MREREERERGKRKELHIVMFHSLLGLLSARSLSLFKIVEKGNYMRLF